MRGLTPIKRDLLTFMVRGGPPRVASADELAALHEMAGEGRVQLEPCSVSDCGCNGAGAWGVTPVGRRALWVDAQVQHALGVAA